MSDYPFITDLTFCYDAALRARFAAGELGDEWAKRFPELFDADDLRILTTAHQRKYHFFEWLGAILLYQATGCLSLIEKYGSVSHPKKTEIFNGLVGSSLDEIDDSGWPDLFCYKPGSGGFRFCEVKGESDQLSEQQLITFRQLHAATGKPVIVLWLKAISCDD